ncbi:hypothetical protein E1202_22265 [Saccharopolyspora karakumensis]|uniref:Uncharacterized protein n=1 Tax=Saccharopolyspora karakumensis TaxID=2530386 RepID=A0A4R5BIN8_9PSEU|nr:hypothetical protein [Saccharopolyspora karakumensis]TDD84956.1 hypothetical protein E1202_22265 [Saccharopolyspora karakumensis]
MTVSEMLSATLTARQWVRPDEPIVWATWQHNFKYHVPGCDERGNPIPKRKLSDRLGKAAGNVAGAVAVTALTLAFGDGDDHSGSDGERITLADLTIVGPKMECAAVELFQRERPTGYAALWQLWVLTPARLLILVTHVDDAVPKSKPQPGWRELLHKPEEFGRNEPGEHIPAWRIAPWLEFPLQNVAQCQTVGPKRKPHRHCGLEFTDGSGFVLHARTPRDAQFMADTVNHQRGIRG